MKREKGKKKNEICKGGFIEEEGLESSRGRKHGK